MSCHDTAESTRLVREEPLRGTEADNTRGTREKLILEHLPQVKLLAQRIKQRLPASVQEEDLYAAGIIGLIAAVDRYRPEYQTCLRTFAEYKIRSAILDSLRALDWVSRKDRQRGRLLDKAQTVLEQKHQRPPTEDELAGELGLSLPQYHAWRGALPGPALESLETTVIANANTLGRFLADPAHHGPSAVYERADREDTMQRVLATLPEREQTVLRLYYYEERTLRDIAKLLQIDESRVSQIKKQAVGKLRMVLRNGSAINSVR